jgi:hypothetical protein
MRIGRLVYRRIFWGGLLCIFMLWVLSTIVAPGSKGRLSEPPECAIRTAFAWTFWVWLLLGRRVAYWLVPLFVSMLTCPGCGEEIDALAIWSCACGFHPSREHHILANRCPMCGKIAGHVNCPQCDCTILLW